ncbi:MAG: FUSC family protein [Asticcacaulis sp.]|uniref:FUSC family protein n=1 Tax=Asticcacaulis sp. TaxID=1872648 RepID=UPI0039E21E7D
MTGYPYGMTGGLTTFSWSRFNWPQGAFAARLVLAAVLALFAGHFLPGGHAFSAVLSALIVVRPYSQGALRAGLMRLVATLSGIALSFGTLFLHRFGLNDYVRLLIGVVPLALLTAYNSEYRSSLIAAVLMLGAASATTAGVEEAAVARAIVVGLGACIGIAVSVLVLPTPHKRAVADKALQILAQMIGGLLTPPDARSEKADTKLRRALLDLSQMHRDNGKGHAEDDPSGQMVRLVRHAQAVCLLLRVEWRREPGEGREAFCAALLAQIDALRAGQSVDDKTVWQALPEVTGVQNWMVRALAGDVTRLAKLIS